MYPAAARVDGERGGKRLVLLFKLEHRLMAIAPLVDVDDQHAATGDDSEVPVSSEPALD